MTLQRTQLAVLFVALVLTSCGYRKFGGGGSYAGSPVFYEVEPNNFPGNANWVSSVAAGDTFVIRGDVSEFSGDWFDGFSFYALEAVDVEFVLTIDDPTADLDVCWFDPIAGAHITCWETSFNPERGVLPLYAGEDFHLVVSPYSGSSGYTLQVIVRSVGYAPAGGAVPAATPEGPAKGPRQMPLERYYQAQEALVEAGEGEPALLAAGRLIEVDGKDGSLRSRPLEVTREGVRIGPLSIGLGRSR